MTLDATATRASGANPVVAPCGEDERAFVLAAYGLDALQDDPELSAIAHFAAQLCNAPTGVVTMVESERQRFIARAGIDERETPRAVSFCAHAMLGSEPMVVVDARSDPRFADNGLVKGPPHIRFYAGAPLVSGEGVPLGALAVIDSEPRPGGLTELQRQGLETMAQAVMCRLSALRAERESQARAFESARAMREIADLVPGVVWSADSAGKFDYFNVRWELTTGAPPPTDLSDWRHTVHADDTERTLAAWQTSFGGGKPFESEYRLKQADGSWRWTLARALPVHDRQGEVIRWYGTLTDVDDGHRQSENRDLLARELSHRIKNIFAVIAGLVSLRARQAPEAAEFAQGLVGTIHALGRAHDYVRPMEGVKGDNLRGLLTELMAPYDDGNGRVAIVGDDCPIGPRAATPLALAFHELATNSAKYGALSVEGGSVRIEIDCPDGGTVAHIHWREKDGPSATDPGDEGFGSRLMKSAIEGQLSGKLERRFEAGGLEVDLSVPFASMHR
ncbi:sensor histidine kinase [Parafrankia sp. BMG5.11]|uniref:sensor histidine kinase n=1 Tax=Parafrankia sp. BMG5.11 TaxID=222540 RepID=UPI001039D3DD|nr:PAS domain-containing protein [Parafrankia sp. BMG5.11]TCJ39839.1 GAF domain-containing protein [Parafrankia sp. BMG5.11]